MPQLKKEAKRSVEKVSRRGGARRKGPEISIPVASELANSLAKIGSPDNRIILWTRPWRSDREYAAYRRGRCCLSGA